MRGIGVLLAYLVGLSALVTVAAASQKARLAKPAKQAATAPQKEPQPQKRYIHRLNRCRPRSRKMAHVTRERKEEAPMFSSGFDA
jgi:hypothetical protein